MPLLVNMAAPPAPANAAIGGGLPLPHQQPGGEFIHDVT